MQKIHCNILNSYVNTKVVLDEDSFQKADSVLAG
jgi:hypothetical protein